MRALESWLSEARIEEGSVFRQVTRHGHVGLRALSGDAVAVITKAVVEDCGFHGIVITHFTAS